MRAQQYLLARVLCYTSFKYTYSCVQNDDLIVLRYNFGGVYNTPKSYFYFLATKAM